MTRVITFTLVWVAAMFALPYLVEYLNLPPGHAALCGFILAIFIAAVDAIAVRLAR